VSDGNPPVGAVTQLPAAVIEAHGMKLIAGEAGASE